MSAFRGPGPQQWTGPRRLEGRRLGRPRRVSSRFNARHGDGVMATLDYAFAPQVAEELDCVVQHASLFWI